MFGVVLKVIWSNLEESWFLTVFGQQGWTNPWDFGQNFKVAQTFCIGKTSREIMFGVVLKVIWSNLEESWFLTVFGQQGWTNPLGFWSKFKICLNCLYR